MIYLGAKIVISLILGDCRSSIGKCGWI